MIAEESIFVNENRTSLHYIVEKTNLITEERSYSSSFNILWLLESGTPPVTHRLFPLVLQTNMHLVKIRNENLF